MTPWPDETDTPSRSAKPAWPADGGAENRCVRDAAIAGLSRNGEPFDLTRYWAYFGGTD